MKPGLSLPQGGLGAAAGPALGAGVSIKLIAPTCPTLTPDEGVATADPHCRPDPPESYPLKEAGSGEGCGGLHIGRLPKIGETPRLGSRLQEGGATVAAGARNPSWRCEIPTSNPSDPSNPNESAANPTHTPKPSPAARLHSTPRCGARTRAGTPCSSPAVRGSRRCRMHGGKGSGAPRGPKNGAWKGGAHTRELAESRRALRALGRLCRSLGHDL